MKRTVSFLCAIVFPLSILICQVNQNVLVETGFAEINGTKLYYEIAGEGEPIVFIHGNFGDRRHWDHQFEELAKKFRVLRYDVRGFGKSAVPVADESYNHCKDLKALLNHLKMPLAHVCGLSMGSGIAVAFAITYPEYCLSLIPIGPWAGGYGSGDFKSPNADSLFAVFPKIGEKLTAKGPREAANYIWSGDQCLARSVRNPSTRNALLTMGYDYSYWHFQNRAKQEGPNPPAMYRLNEIKLPTLIITAEFDLESCKEIGDIMDREIENSTLISIDDAGHIMNMDKPDEFNSKLIGFIEGLK